MRIIKCVTAAACLLVAGSSEPLLAQGTPPGPLVYTTSATGSQTFTSFGAAEAELLSWYSALRPSGREFNGQTIKYTYENAPQVDTVFGTPVLYYLDGVVEGEPFETEQEDSAKRSTSVTC